MSADMYPSWPRVRCVACATVYDSHGASQPTCPACRCTRFNTSMTGNVVPFGNVPAGLYGAQELRS